MAKIALNKSYGGNNGYKMQEGGRKHLLQILCTHDSIDAKVDHLWMVTIVARVSRVARPLVECQEALWRC